MRDSVFIQKGIKLSIPKMRATVTNNSTEKSKLVKDVALGKLDHNFMVISVSGHYFDPFRNVVNGHKNVFKSELRRKRIHEVNS